MTFTGKANGWPNQLKTDSERYYFNSCLHPFLLGNSIKTYPNAPLKSVQLDGLNLC